MAIDTNTKIGSLLESYVNLYTTRWNSGCDVCWFIFGQLVAGLAGSVVGFGTSQLWFG